MKREVSCFKYCILCSSLNKQVYSKKDIEKDRMDDVADYWSKQTMGMTVLVLVLLYFEN